MLHSLSRMPADLSSDARRQLLNAVTDLFLLDDDPSEGAKSHYGEIAIQSLSHLDSGDRKRYADNVASVSTLPRDVAMTLGGDSDADVARLVLKLSPVLTDTDLAAIAVSQSQRHLVAIAERVSLSEGLTDILVERGDSSVLQTVSANEGASFSDTGFDKLLQRGGGDQVVAQALSRRSDLSPNRAQRVLRIVEQMAGDGAEGQTAADVSLARQARQQRFEVRLLLADLKAKVRQLDDVVIMLADEDRAYHLAQILAQAADLSTEQALRVLMQKDASGIAVACKSHGIGKDAFRAIMLLRSRRLYFSAQDVEDAVSDYVRLDAATADRTIRFLKVKTKLN